MSASMLGTITERDTGSASDLGDDVIGPGLVLDRGTERGGRPGRGTLVNPPSPCLWKAHAPNSPSCSPM